jgi:hypothetical protein
MWCQSSRPTLALIILMIPAIDSYAQDRFWAFQTASLPIAPKLSIPVIWLQVCITNRKVLSRLRLYATPSITHHGNLHA